MTSALPPGAWCPAPCRSVIPQTQDLTRTRTRSDVKKPANALTRRRLNAQERHAHQHTQAQRALEALRHALDDLGVPDALVPEIEGRLRAQQQRLGNRFALLCPTLCGCRHASALTRTRGWDTHRPSRLLGAWPTRAGLTRLRTLGPEVLGALGRPIATRRDATRSRWPWTGGLEASVFRNARSPLAVGGT